MLKLNTDCRYYNGEKPCRHARLCEGCSHYEPWLGQVLVIKTAAMGDVLRSTSILPALEKKYPGYKVVWAAAASSAPLVKNNPLVHEVLEVDSGIQPALMAREFDIIISLDKTPVECGLSNILKAKEKVGIGLSAYGTPYPLNAEAEYYFELGLSDDLKFHKNKKTYHELVREACRLEPGKDAPSIYLTESEKNAAAVLLVEEGLSADSRKLGIVVGAGKTFANKAPSAQWWNGFIETTRKMAAPGGMPELVLLGGPADIPEIEALKSVAGRFSVAAPGDVRTFAAVVGMMDAIVCGDTLAMHIATALGKPAVVLFGPTCEAEIDLFGRGEKILTPISCSPCYKGECGESPSCMDTIDQERVAQWALSVL